MVVTARPGVELPAALMEDLRLAQDQDWLMEDLLDASEADRYIPGRASIPDPYRAPALAHGRGRAESRRTDRERCVRSCCDPAGDDAADGAEGDHGDQ